MSIASLLPPLIAPSPIGRLRVVVEDRITIPGWIGSLATFRQWAESDEYPTQGWVSYLDGAIWVDANMEDFLSHNQIKQAFNAMFGGLLAECPLGRFVPDRMLLVNLAANVSTEPDGLFFRWETMQTQRLQLVPGRRAGHVQLEGTPDAVLEIISDSSEEKDTTTLRALYWKAEIPEYWLVDARADPVRFDILQRGATGYEPTPAQNGWLTSTVLGHALRIERTLDPLGLPQFAVRFKRHEDATTHPE